MVHADETILAIAPIWSSNTRVVYLKIHLIFAKPLPFGRLLDEFQAHRNLTTLIVNTRVTRKYVTNNEINRLIQEHIELVELRLFSYIFNVAGDLRLLNDGYGLVWLNDFIHCINTNTHGPDLMEELSGGWEFTYRLTSLGNQYIHLKRPNYEAINVE